MPDLTGILQRGYFPKELPPCFSTATYAAALTEPTATRPSQFDPNGSLPESKPVMFALARPGMLRRRLTIPHPTAFYRISRLLADHWATIATHCATSTLSLSVPVDDPVGRAVKMRDGFAARPVRRAVDRAGSRYLLRADLAEFYPTLYTHSIPWALHSKPTAKANKNRINATPPGLLGNDFDFHYQRCNSNHTKGIAIGPDPSFVIAESVLTACDSLLVARLSGVRGFRIYDDFELCFDSLEQAEHGLAVLQGVLAEYELALNPRKTKIVALPDHLGDDFVSALAKFNFGTEPASQAAVLIAFFDWLFTYFKCHPDEHVVSYGVGRFKKEAIAPSNWEMLTGLLLQAANADSSVWANVAEILEGAFRKGLPIAKPIIARSVNAAILRHAPCGNSSELAWGLWLMLRLRLNVSAKATEVLGGLDDPVVALLTLDAEAAGLLQGTLDKTRWQARMSTQDLKSDQWLLAYEAFVQGWLASPTGTDHLTADVEFHWLRNQGVRFYERVAAAAVAAPKAKVPVAVAPKAGTAKAPSKAAVRTPSLSPPIGIEEPSTEATEFQWFY
ncbi:MAG: RNA-directed DNA polymerase [Planctomycetota bacterium]|nr:RNA-directed DNA polymerase [Planctomycetota bacterium]